MECLYCNELDAREYPAFSFSGQGSYKLKEQTFPLHENCYDLWYKRHIAGLANFDKIMNYCRYFQRKEGNEGHYIRDGKSCLVDGRWSDYDIQGGIIGDGGKLKRFQEFLKDNKWGDWFEIMDKYKSLI